MTLAADSREVFPTRPRALAAIQAHRRIARVKAQSVGKWVMKFTAGKGIEQVDEGDAACDIK